MKEEYLKSMEKVHNELNRATRPHRIGILMSLLANALLNENDNDVDDTLANLDRVVYIIRQGIEARRNMDKREVNVFDADLKH